MAEKDSEATNEMSRRNFLKSVGAGVSLSAITMVDEEMAKVGDHKYDPEKEVPYVAGWKNHFEDGEFAEKEPIYSSMPVERWDDIQATRNAVSQLGDYLAESNLNEDEFVFLKTTDKNVSGGQRIEIAHLGSTPYDMDEIEETVPDHVPGYKPEADQELDIPVESSKGSIDKQDAYEQPNGEYKSFTNIAGGAPIVANGGSGTACTAGPFHHRDHGPGWITNQHAVDDDDSADSDVLGKAVSAAVDPNADYASSEHMGEVSEYRKDEVGSSEFDNGSAPIDLAFIEKTAPFSDEKYPHEWMAGRDYLDNDDLPLTTVLADVELEKQEGDSSWNVKVQGQTTGRSTSYIHTIVYNNSGEVIGGFLDDDYTDAGDSGGPYFHELNGEAYICGVHVGVFNPSTSWDSASYFNTAETVEQEFNGEWDAQ